MCKIKVSNGLVAYFNYLLFVGGAVNCPCETNNKEYEQ